MTQKDQDTIRLDDTAVAYVRALRHHHQRLDQKPKPYTGEISPAAARVLAIQAEWKAAAERDAGK